VKQVLAATEPGKPPSPPRPSVSVRAFVLRFLLGFALLEGLVYALLWHPTWFEPYAVLNARLTALLAAPFVEDLQALGSSLVAPAFSILVRPGCDGYQASAVLLAGVAAFPAPRARKWIGAALGVGLLLALNPVRLGVLVWAGVHRPELFDLLHVEVLPALFVAAALAIMLAWALWARK
jgi:exosortase/archaeosortase family protein